MFSGPLHNAGPDGLCEAYPELRYCGCTFAEGNTVMPDQVRMLP